MSERPCFCPCHRFPGVYNCEPCSQCGHYNSRGEMQPGWDGRGGWLSKPTEAEQVRAVADPLLEALEGLTTDVAHFAQTVHQAHHQPAHGATWQHCDRGICPGVRRALERVETQMRAARQGAAGGAATDG